MRAYKLLSGSFISGDRAPRYSCRSAVLSFLSLALFSLSLFISFADGAGSVLCISLFHRGNMGVRIPQGAPNDFKEVERVGR